MKCMSGSLFLEVWRLDPLKGPSEKTGQPVLRAGCPSVCGVRSGSGPPWKHGPSRGLVDAEVAPFVPGSLEAAPQFSGALGTAIGWRTVLRFLSPSPGGSPVGFMSHCLVVTCSLENSCRQVSMCPGADTNLHTALISAAVPEATRRHRLTPISHWGPAGQTRGVEPSLCAGGLPFEASVLSGGAVPAVHHESRTLARQRASLKPRRGEPLAAPVPLTWCALSPLQLIPDTHSWFSAAFPRGCLGSPESAAFR